MSPDRHRIKQEDHFSSMHHYTMAPSLPQCSIPCSPLDTRPDAFLKSGPIYLDYSEVPLAKSLRRHETDISPLTDLSYVSSPESSSPSPPASPMSSRPHIPRPPNAFMIYRSELIKNRTIPLGVEHRQQNISRLAGECWNLLSPEEKEVYHKKAAAVLLEHQRLNPNYKFTPAPRGSRRSKGKAQAESVSEDSQRIRNIREQYVKVLGPSLVAARRRKRKTAKDKSLERDKGSYPSPVLEINPGLTFSGPSSPDSPSSPMTVGSDDHSSFFTPPSFPQATLPRRPSTTLGFKISQEQTAFNNPFMNFPRPYSAEGLSTVLQGLDMAGPGMHDIASAPNPQLPFQPIPHFNFDAFTLSGSIPVHFNPFAGHDSLDILNMPFGHPMGTGQTCADVNVQSFNLQLRSPCEVSALDTGVNAQQGSPPAYNAWPMVINPSDDINYAINRQAFSTPLPQGDLPASH